MELREVAASVYACLQEDRGLGCSNSGLINHGPGLVVDTFWDLPHTREMIGLYADVWAQPAAHVVNTHHNGDHCWGNQLFPESEIIGHRLCAESFEDFPPDVTEALRLATDSEDPAIRDFAEKLAPWDFSGIELTPPTRLVEDRLDLELDGLPLEILYVGPAHTMGDVIVHLPEQRVVFAGDILFYRCTPISWEGTFERWIAALDRIIAFEPEVVVPGHGPICGTEGPESLKSYLFYVRDEAKCSFEAGIPVLEAAKKMDLGPFADWTEPERLVFNIERVYRELRGDSVDAPIDALTLFRQMYELSQSRNG